MRFAASKKAIHGAALAVLIGASACAPLLGFEDFDQEGAGESTGDGDGDVSCEGDDCPEEVCQDGESRCSGGETILEAQSCSADRTEFQAVDLCDVGNLQCNPTTGGCFELKIDATEVTQKDYGEFLAAAVDISEQEKGCAFNDSYAPDEECAADDSVCVGEGCENHPQVCVDWCDAAAYCAFRGKRLCGALGTGALVDFEDGFSDPGESEWMNACSAGGQYEFGQGNTNPETDPQACTYAGRLDTTYEVGSRDDCFSPGRSYTNISDMSGNVAEWENNCETTVTKDTDETVACRVRGGSFLSELDGIKCAQVTSIAQERGHVAPDIGFRCCSD